MAAGADPDPFHTTHDGAATWVVRAGFEDALRRVGFPDRESVQALFARAAAEAPRGRASTAAIALPDRPERVHLRPVRHGGLLAPLWGERLLGLRRPVRELRVTETLRRRGAPVPLPVLVVGWRAAPFWTALLGTQHVPSSLDALAWLEAHPDPALLVPCAEQAGRAVRAFHEAGGRHADLHVKNLLVLPDGSVRVIDLDRARAGPPPPARRRMRELMRLYRSLLKRRVFERVGREGRRAFFDAYTGGDARLASALMAHWPRERRRVARHQRGYRDPG